MDVLKDIFSLLAAANLLFPHLGTILICSGAVLICSGIIFWRPATDRDQREQTPLPSGEPAPYRPDLGSSDGRERRPDRNTATTDNRRSGSESPRSP